MKLTPEQIEAERVKFEKWSDGNPNAFPFNAWLACRERTEIKITGNAATNGPWQQGYNCAVGECKEEIESQGFTVVTK